MLADTFLWVTKLKAQVTLQLLNHFPFQLFTSTCLWESCQTVWRSDIIKKKMVFTGCIIQKELALQQRWVQWIIKFHSFIFFLCTIVSKINGTPICVYLSISKLHSILAVANLLAHNNISQICYSGQISLQSAAVKCSFSDNLTPLRVTFILLTLVHTVKTCIIYL